jgi:hypothetical protein
VRWALRGLWAIANLAGVFAFLMLAYPTWIEPELKDYPGASGGAGVVWALTALPVFLGFFFANLIWAGLATYEASKGRGRTPMILASATLVAWIAAFIFDGAHHGS